MCGASIFSRLGKCKSRPFDRSPVMQAVMDVGFPCMLTPRRFTDEEEAFHARSDYFNLGGARGEPAGRRVDPSAWCGREHNLSLEVEAWRHGIVRCQAVSRSQARQRQTQEAVGRGGAEGAEIAAVAQWYAYCLADLSRSLAWPRLKGRDDAELRHRLKVLAGRYPHMAIRSCTGYSSRKGSSSTASARIGLPRGRPTVACQVPQEDHAAPDVDAVPRSGQRALVRGLRVRSTRQWPEVPCSQPYRRPYPIVCWLDRRHVDLRFPPSLASR